MHHFGRITVYAAHTHRRAKKSRLLQYAPKGDGLLRRRHNRANTATDSRPSSIAISNAIPCISRCQVTPRPSESSEPNPNAHRGAPVRQGAGCHPAPTSTPRDSPAALKNKKPHKNVRL